MDGVGVGDRGVGGGGGLMRERDSEVRSGEWV